MKWLGVLIFAFFICSKILAYDIEDDAAATAFPPNYIKIILDESKPTYVLWLADVKENDAYVFCTDPSNNLELFVTKSAEDLSPFNLYDSETINDDKFVGDLTNTTTISSDASNVPRNILSTSGCFTLWSQTDNETYATVLFKATTSEINNCLTDYVVFEADTSSTIFSFGANETGPCEIIILSSQNQWPGFQIGKITASPHKIYTFKSAINQKIFLDLNYAHYNYWNNFGLYTPALKIVIPESENIDIVVSIMTDFYQVSKHGCTYIQKGILASPGYAGFNRVFNETDILYQGNMDLDTMLFTVNKLYGNEEVYESIFNHTFSEYETISFNGTAFQIYITEIDPTQDGFLIEYTLTSLLNLNRRDTIILDNTNPYYLTFLDDVQVNDMYTFCSAKANDLELFITNGNNTANSGFWLFESAGMDNCINFPTGGSIIPSNMKAKSNCFTLYRQSGDSSQTTVLIRSNRAHTKGCSSTSNIYQLSTDVNDFPVAALENKICEMIILTPSYVLQQLSIEEITMSANSTSTFTSPINNRKLFDLTDSDAPNWKKFGIYTYALSATINDGNDMNVKAVFKNGSYAITKLIDGQKGIMASPGYCGINIDNELHAFYSIYHIFNITADLTVKSLYGNMTVLFQNQDKWINTNFTVKNQKTSQNGTTFGLYAVEGNTPIDGFLIEYTLNDVLHPQTLNINLNSTNPNYAIWLDDMPINEAMTVCSKGGPLTIHVTTTNEINALTKYRLFDSTILLNYTTDLSAISMSLNNNFYGINVPGNLTSKTGYYTIYREAGPSVGATAFFSIPSVHKQHCTNPNNVFQALQPNYSNSMTLFSAGARSTGSCEMIIFSSQISMPLISIENISATADTIFSFKTMNTQNGTFILNGNETSSWKNVGIYTYALSVIVPPSKIINILAYSGKGPYSIKATENTQKGIMSSPNFKSLPSNAINPLYSIASSETINLNIIVKKLDKAATIILGDLVNNKNRTLISNDNFTQNGTNFNLYYSATNSTNNEFLLEYTITKGSIKSNNSIVVSFNVYLFLAIVIITKLFYAF